MTLAYSFFCYLSYGAIFHPTVVTAPEKSKDAIIAAVNSLESVAEDNVAGLEAAGIDDSDEYLWATAIDMFGDADNQTIGIGRSLLNTIWIETTLTRCEFPLKIAVDRSSYLNANKTPLIGRARNLYRVNYAITELESAIGVDPIMFVLGLSHLTPVPDDPSIMYDDWANVGIRNDDNYQRCLRTTGPGEDLVMASTFEIAGINGGPTLSYIVICADGQAWVEGDSPTLYEILQEREYLLDSATIDDLQTLDFALLEQILDTPVALHGIPATASANEVSGYDACVSAKDPYNAGT